MKNQPITKTNHWLWFGTTSLAFAVYFTSSMTSPTTDEILGFTQNQPNLTTQTYICDQNNLCPKDLEILNKSFPTYADAYLHIAYYYWLNQEIELATQNLKTAQKLDPLNPYFETLEKFLK